MSLIIILVLPPVACQIEPSQCLAQPMAMPLAVVRSWVEQALFIRRCFMVCLMPQSQVSGSSIPHFNMFTLDRPTCVRNRLSAFQVVQGFSAPVGRCSSAHWRPGARVVLSLTPPCVCFQMGETRQLPAGGKSESQSRRQGDMLITSNHGN